MVKTYFKTIGRMLKKHIIRLISLIAIILISVSFISGIGSSSDIIEDSITDYYKAQNVSDIIVKSKTSGFTSEQIEKIEIIYGKENVQTGMSLDIPTTEKRSLRLYFLDLNDCNINKLELLEGNYIETNDKNLAYAEISDNVISGYAVGEKIELDIGNSLNLPIPLTYNVQINGIVKCPLTFSKDGEPSYNNPADAEIPDTVAKINDMDILENILYCSKDLLPAFITQGDLYITIQNRNLFNAFSDGYQKYIDEQKSVLIRTLGDDIKILTLYDNISFKSICVSADNVRNIGYVLIGIFLAVTVLIVFSSMTRLMEEERSQIACLKTLGYSSFSIIMRYLLFIIVPLSVGGAASYFVGYGLSRLIREIFTIGFDLPPMPAIINPSYYFLALGVIVLSTLFAIFVLGLKMTNKSPAALMRPKTPKSGGKTLLESISFIWKRLPFKYKSSLRNVSRYKSRFFMMLVSIAVSAGLVFAGLALLDVCLFTDFGSASIIGIAVLVVVFAALLTIVVINILTTINLSERYREIATLMVLGYHDNEVCGYIFREIFINTIIGILFGYPVGIGLATLVFNTMGFGTISGVSWFMWLLVPIVILSFTWLVTLVLRPKITKTKMNESLKAIE